MQISLPQKELNENKNVLEMEKTYYKDIIQFTADDSIKNVVVCGDIHCAFNEIINKVCKQIGITDSVIIIAGDCAFGFYKYGYYENIYKRNEKVLEESNNYICMIRGNHDNPEYFKDGVFEYPRLMTIPDYSVIEAAGHSVLCVGGAISIDRTDRIEDERKDNVLTKKYQGIEEFRPRYYWKDEMPVFDEVKLKQIYEIAVIDTVVTHTAPSFCEKLNKTGIAKWIEKDDALEDDIFEERRVMDQIFNNLLFNKQPVANWLYGHFHDSWSGRIEEILFNMLNINELKQLW